MSCFPCFSSQKSKKGIDKNGNDNASSSSSGHRTPPPPPKSPETTTPKPPEEVKDKPQEGEKIDAQSFTFRELATATKNFRQECLLGEGGFGKVFKATLQSGQAQPFFRDPKRFPDLADPLLGRLFPEKDLNQAVAVTAMCLQEEAEVRPLIADVMTALSFLSTVPDENLTPLPYPPEPEPEEEEEEEDDAGDDYSSESSDSDTESRKIGKGDRDGASANFTSARNHDSDTSDDEDEQKDNSSKKKPKNKDSEQKRVVFKDDVQPNHSRKNSSSSSDGGSSPRSSNASENRRIDSRDSSFKLQKEASDIVNSTDSTLEHKSSDSDGGSEHDGKD
ncbi:putative serine/threonine-protein kinase PBL26, partial [Cucurbita argyrosperma subsp. argyrosperma]